MTYWKTFLCALLFCSAAVPWWMSTLAALTLHKQYSHENKWGLSHKCASFYLETQQMLMCSCQNKYIKSPIWLKRPWMELYWVYKNVLVLFFWITLSLLFLIFSTRHKRGWKQIVFILLMHLYWKWLKSLVWFFAVYFMAVTHFDNSLL